MKNLMVAVLSVITFAQAAKAVVIPGWERPLMQATLTYVDGSFFPRATTLTLNQRDGQQDPTSFTLVEDTGIRCKKAPCPSEKVTEFTIVKITPSHRGEVVRYEAIEVLTNIPPNVRIAPRRLNVVESSMELVAPGGGGFMRRTMWDVEVVTFPNQVQTYSGSPEYVASIALDVM